MSLTLYDFTQALIRYRRFLIGGLIALFALVLIMSFSFSDGGLQLRGSSKYEAEIQIAVVSPTTESLTEADTGTGLDEAAALYAGMLGSNEAAAAVGEMTGYQLSEAMAANADRNTPLITNKVIGPSETLAADAAVNSFLWLGDKLAEPLVTIDNTPTDTTPEIIVLSGPFDTVLTVILDEGLSTVSDSLFLTVADDTNDLITIPISAAAATKIRTSSSLDPNTTLVLTIETADGAAIDTLRIAPVPPPSVVDAYPTLDLVIGPNAVQRVTTEEDETTWRLLSTDISAEWIEGTPRTGLTDPSEQVKIALLTPDPSPVKIGGRRGPILGFALLLVGIIGLLTAVIVADAWRREKERQEPGTSDDVSADGTPQVTDEPADAAETAETEEAADAVEAALADHEPPKKKPRKKPAAKTSSAEYTVSVEPTPPRK